MNEYNYTREIVDSEYNINNPARLDGEGNQIFLGDEIVAALPGKSFKILGDAGVCKIQFDTALTDGEKTTLDTVVSNHKNNT